MEYFETIGIREPIQKRIEAIYGYFESLVPNEEIIDVFVNDIVQTDGTRTYEALRFYTEKRSFLASNFINADDFKIGAEGRVFEVVNLKSENYDFKRATAKSRLNITGHYSTMRLHGPGMYLHGSGENCDYLIKIYHKHVLPRLARKIP